ncbi:MAG: glycosyltransferase family 2 protein [archaeon]
MKDLTIIIPTLNEEKTIAKSLKELFYVIEMHHLKADVLVIDDSTDGTNQKIRDSKLPIQIIDGNNKGIGSALRNGLMKAKSRYAIICMADFSNEDFSHIPEIYSKLLQGVDIVQTSRFTKVSVIKGYPKLKFMANRLCNSVAGLLFGRRELKDFTSLYKGFRLDKIKKLNLSSNGFDVGLEIVLKGIKKKYNVAEIPVNWTERSCGISKFKLFGNGFSYFARVLKIWLK